jgi:hypothetical protein
VGPGHGGPRQVEVAAHPQPVAQQPGQPRASGQRQLPQLGAFHADRGVEIAVFEPERERDGQPGQVHWAAYRDVLQPEPARIDLVLELQAAAAEQGCVDRAPAGLVRTVQDPALPARFQQFSLADVIHDSSPLGDDQRLWNTLSRRATGLTQCGGSPMKN